jgi:hypothetical protein
MQDAMQRQAAAAMTVRTGGRVLLVAMWLASGAAASTAGAADNLRRCEDSAGHVTYSNEACPDGTSRERKVENRPAVEVPRDPATEKSALGARPGGIVPSGAPVGTRAPAVAETEQEVAQEKRKALVARCDDLVRRIEYGQQDLLSAAPGERASVELGVRRLQEEHESLCAPPKPQ